MDRDEVWRAIDEERLSLADFLEDLSAEEWETPSLCAGWRVRDVAAHLTLAQTGPLSLAVVLLRARGSVNRMIHDTAVRQARLPVEQFPVLLRGMVGSRKKIPVVTHLEPLIDILVHGQDIAIPLGRPRPMPLPAAAAAASRVWPDLLPFRPQQKLRGLRLVATDHPWSAGEGLAVEGPLSALLLLMTGRDAALSHLSGPGVSELHARRSASPRP